MTLAEKFAAAVARAQQTVDDPELLLPGILVQACVDVLPVHGAGLAVTTQELRLPLAASNRDAAAAEQLQTTLGQGPCLTAAESAQPLVAGMTEMGALWPMFYRGLTDSTPFRSVMSLPLRVPTGEPFGAMDLYSGESDPAHLRALSYDGTVVTAEVSAMLFGAPSTAPSADVSGFSWLHTGPAARRMNVWTAVGTLLAHTGFSHHDALAVLRSYAFSHDTTIDDVADQIVTQRLQPSAVV